MIISHPKRIFFGGVVGQVTTVGLATTYTGLVLTNPLLSGVNVCLTNVGAAFTVAFAAGSALGLFWGISGTAVTQTTPIIPCNQFSGGIGKALLASSATLPVAPVLMRVLGAGLTGAITTAPSSGAGFSIPEGEIMFPPGAFVGIYTSTASGAAGGNLSFTWEEHPTGT